MRITTLFLGAMLAMTMATPMDSPVQAREAKEALDTLKQLNKRCTFCACGRQGCCNCTGPFFCNNCRNGGDGVGCKGGRKQCGCRPQSCFCCA